MAAKKFVWVLIASTDHESSDLVGVFETEDGAKTEQERQYRLKERASRWFDKWDGESPWRTFSQFQNADSFDIQKAKLKP